MTSRCLFQGRFAGASRAALAGPAARRSPGLAAQQRLFGRPLRHGPSTCAPRKCSKLRAAEGSAQPKKQQDRWTSDNPHLILRVSPGTSFEGLKVARDNALEDAGDDETKIKLVHESFDRFIEGSRRKFLEGVESMPGTPEPLFMLANFHHTIGEAAEAEARYREALALDSANLDCLNALAVILQSQGRQEEAEEIYESAVEMHPEDVDLLFNYATLRLQQKDLPGVKRLVDMIVKVKPEMADHPLVKELADV